MSKKKKKSRKRTHKTKPIATQKNTKNKRIPILILFFCVIIVIGYFTVIKTDKKGSVLIPPIAPPQQPTSIQFKKEGELTFLRKETNKPIKKIDIEIAKTSLERQQGLMYRTSMPDSVGMLFIFEQAELRSFWMKDTYISLDILYIDEKKEIITIHRNTNPESEESILSYKNAQYVVELNTGFCDKYDIKEGDSIEFESLK